MDPQRGIRKNPYEAKANFIYNFKCDPSLPHYGFKSWDDFFTREFNPGVRTVSRKDKDPDVIVNACESAPYNYANDVKLKDKFWMKGQPYSLTDIFANHPLTSEFGDNSTIYQAFLCAKTYHRWNSPVDGKIVAIENIPGTYYAEAPVEGYDPAGPNDSQGYITELAARALVFIRADNPRIGLMCFVAVGMAPGISIGIADGIPVSQILQLNQGIGFSLSDDMQLYLNNAFIFGSLLYDQNPDLALSILLWVKDWAAQSNRMEELFYRSTSLATLLNSQLNAEANGAVFVPYLTANVYTSLANAYATDAAKYESDYRQLSTQKILTEENIAMANTMVVNSESEIQYVNALLQQANDNYNKAVSAANNAQLNFNNQKIVVDHESKDGS